MSSATRLDQISRIGYRLFFRKGNEDKGLLWSKPRISNDVDCPRYNSPRNKESGRCGCTQSLDRNAAVTQCIHKVTTDISTLYLPDPSGRQPVHTISHESNDSQQHKGLDIISSDNLLQHCVFRTGKMGMKKVSKGANYMSFQDVDDDSSFKAWNFQSPPPPQPDDSAASFSYSTFGASVSTTPIASGYPAQSPKLGSRRSRKSCDPYTLEGTGEDLPEPPRAAASLAQELRLRKKKLRPKSALIQPPQFQVDEEQLNGSNNVRLI